MHVFVPVYFNAQLGGLHSHVMSQVKALLSTGNSCTVMCKPGPFSDSLTETQAHVLESNFEDIHQSVAEAINAGPFDLVHTHPSRSRVVGCIVAEQLEVPLILTIHGMYLDSIDWYGDSVDFILTVGESIRKHIIENSNFSHERVFVIPNGVDTNIFCNTNIDIGVLDESFPEIVKPLATDNDRRVFFVSRMDEDKKFILDVVKETWQTVIETKAFDVCWIVAGDGTLRKEMEAAAKEVNDQAQREIIVFVGWLDERSISELTRFCHLSVAPGRSALESMACEIPVIAIGSKGYIGLIDNENALMGISTNFGGVGGTHADYTPKSMYWDIDSIIYDDRSLAKCGRLSGKIIENFYKQTKLDEQLLEMYDFCGSLGPRELQTEYQELAIEFPTLAFRAKQRGLSFSSLWARTGKNGQSISTPWTVRHKNSKNIYIDVQGDNKIHVTSRLEEDEKLYLVSSAGPFSLPPANVDSCLLSPETRFIIKVDYEAIDGNTDVQLWVFEYSKSERIAHAHTKLASRSKVNSLKYISSSESVSFKVAFRISGEGFFSLSRLQFFTEQKVAKVSSSHPNEVTFRRYSGDVSYQDYKGENAVFIVGAPRSGTTWMLNLLKEHPDVIAATEKNLDARINRNNTLETNIFNSNRPFTDNQVKRKFYLLSQEYQNKILVEKTPVHLLFADRIRRIFPNAIFVLMLRDGRDVVTSIAKIGQDNDSWWKGAPSNVADATKLWKKYANGAIRCINDHNPYIVRYEELLIDTHGVVTRLLTCLGLSSSQLDRQISASELGKNIPIKGVFRKGGSGEWESFFTDEDIKTFSELAEGIPDKLGYN